MNSDSYESVLKLMEGKQCASCGQIKPRFDFERTVSKAQSKAWGYAGNKPLTIESKLCSVCQSERASTKGKSIRQIENMIASGDIDEVEGTHRIAQLRRAISRQRSTTAHRRWASVRKAEWAGLLDDVREELRRIHQQEKNASKVGVDREFFFEYKQLLQRLRDEFKFKAKHKMEAPDRGENWLEYIPPDTRVRLFKVWEETVIPEAYKVRMKLPAIVAKRVDETDHQRWQEADERRQERLERIEAVKNRRKMETYRAVMNEGPDPISGLKPARIPKPLSESLMANDLALLTTKPKERMDWPDLNDDE